MGSLGSRWEVRAGSWGSLGIAGVPLGTPWVVLGLPPGSPWKAAAAPWRGGVRGGSGRSLGVPGRSLGRPGGCKGRSVQDPRWAWENVDFGRSHGCAVAALGAGRGRVRDISGPPGPPGPAQAAVAGFVKRFVSVRDASLFASIYFAFVLLHFRLSLRFTSLFESSRIEFRSQHADRVGGDIFNMCMCIYRIYMYIYVLYIYICTYIHILLYVSVYVYVCIGI